jgi:hypothetical protein
MCHSRQCDLVGSIPEYCMQFDAAGYLPGGRPQRTVFTILAITLQEAEARFRFERAHISLVSEV